MFDGRLSHAAPLLNGDRPLPRAQEECRWGKERERLYGRIIVREIE